MRSGESSPNQRPHSHGYMPNAGFPEVRARIAARLSERTELPFHSDDIIMTNGAAGALNIVLKAILDPGDEVIVLNPYFPEYRFYIENHGGRVVPVETDERFQPDIARIAAAITPRTKALILNSPNNPTGVRLRRRGARRAEPHRARADAGPERRALPAAGLRRRCVRRRRCGTSNARCWSGAGRRQWRSPGERIGYLAIPPHLPEAAALRNACTFATRILGYINAPGDLAVGRRGRSRRDRRCQPVSGQARPAVRLPGRRGLRRATRRRARITSSRKRRFPTTSPSSASCRRKAFSRCPGRASDGPAICVSR